MNYQNRSPSPAALPVDLYRLSVDEALRELDASRDGLTRPEAAARLVRFGPNALQARTKTPLIVLFLRQLANPLAYILLAAALVKLLVKGALDAAVIGAVLGLMAVIGFVQELRAEKAMEALKNMVTPRSRVRRGGQVAAVTAADLVPGDLVILEAGDRVPVDGRLIEATNLKVNESALTGESMPAEKHTAALTAAAGLADRKNMVHMGTVVTNGRATVLAAATGMQTEMGRIAAAIQNVPQEKTPLQRSVDRFGRVMLFILPGICALLALAGWYRGLPPMDIFLMVVAAAVSAVPEGLPAVVTVTLAVGMRAMAKRQAIIRRLVAVETLGSTTVVCSDKTGTLTLNQMTVSRLHAHGRSYDVDGSGYDPVGEMRADGQTISVQEDATLELLLRAGALCNDALLTGTPPASSILGDPTEGALVVAAAKAGLRKEQLELAWPRLNEIPFQSERQWMATLHSNSGKRTIFVKGAPERVLAMSSNMARSGGSTPLDETARQAILGAVDRMAGDALRVMALAYCDYAGQPGELSEESLRGRLTFLGLAGMSDPPRAEAREAVRQCQEAGIRAVMITGDNPVTAAAVARSIGLPEGRPVTGAEIGRMSDAELDGTVRNTSVFARIEPLHKLRIVQAYKRQGEVVAMTGDGVNDAPALETADIGIAMGITGTDVAKEAADMVLADDNFASILVAIEEGRSIFNRLRNVTFFLLTTCFGELLALMMCVFFLGVAPLEPLQILWINLLTGTIMAIPLGLEPRTGIELRQTPRDPRVGLLYPGLLLRAGFLALLLGVGVTLLFDWTLDHYDLREARTAAFTTIVVFEWLVAFNARSDELTIFRLGILRNRPMLLALVIAVLMQWAVIHLPFLHGPFSTVPLHAYEWVMAMSLGVGMFVTETLRKTIAPRLFSLGKWKPIRWHTSPGATRATRPGAPAP
jgi:Ca2+-transporting ATPase